MSRARLNGHLDITMIFLNDIIDKLEQLLGHCADKTGQDKCRQSVVGNAMARNIHY